MEGEHVMVLVRQMHFEEGERQGEKVIKKMETKKVDNR